MENTAAVEIRQSSPYGKYIKSLGWVVVGNNPQIFIRKIGPFGAIAKIQRFENLNWSTVRPILRQHHVWMTKMEPLRDAVNFHQDSWPMLATKTLRVDLTPTTKNIMDQFKKDCRYSIRKSQAATPKLELNNFEDFYRIWQQAAGIKKLWIPSKKDFDSLVKCFGSNCYCITINSLAGSLILVHDKTAYYYYSGALPEGKKLDLPYLVIWACLQEAKKRGCITWDFEGIYDPRWPNKSWLGFTHFKKSFGGYEVNFPGSFIKWG